MSGPRAGGMLVMALIAVAAVAMMGAAFLQLSSAITRRQTASVDNKRAFYLAEAGLAEAYAGVVVGKTGNVASEEEPAAYGDGVLWVEATEVGSSSVHLESTGMCGTSLVRLGLVVDRPANTASDLGLFASGDLVLEPGTTVDSYDSDLEDRAASGLLGGLLGGVGGLLGGSGGDSVLGGGDGGDGGLLGVLSGTLDALGSVVEGVTSVALYPLEKGARVGSNGTVTVRSASEHPTAVLGDVTPGPDGVVATQGSPAIAGSTEARLVNQVLPDVELPTIDLEPGVDHAGATPYVVVAGETGLEHLTVAAGAEAVIQGPARVRLDSLTVAAGGRLTIDTSYGPVDLYVDGPVTLASGSELHSTVTDARLFNLLVSGPATVELAADASFFGAYYGPQATTTVGSGFEIFGSFVSKDLVLEAGVQMHYDKALGRRSVVHPQRSWRLIEVANHIGSRGITDPFSALGVNRATLETPADSHEDVLLEVKYVNLLGFTQTYSGSESLFDWLFVLKVLGVWRNGQLVGSDLLRLGD